MAAARASVNEPFTFARSRAPDRAALRLGASALLLAVVLSYDGRMEMRSPVTARRAARLVGAGLYLGLVAPGCAPLRSGAPPAAAPAPAGDETAARIAELEPACFVKNELFPCFLLGNNYRSAAEAATEADPGAAGRVQQLLSERLCRLHRHSCQLGEAKSCRELGKSCGLTAEQAAELAETLLFQGCEAKREWACSNFMRVSKAAPWANEPAARERQRRAEELSCEARDIYLCPEAIDKQLRAGSLEKAEALARAAYCRPERSAQCDEDAASRLLFAGRRTYSFSEYSGVSAARLTQIQAHGAAMLERACAAGSGSACVALVYKIERVPRLPRARAALTGLQALCEQGGAPWCLEAAQLLLMEEGLRDPAQSSALFLRHCGDVACLARAGHLLLLSKAPAAAEPLLRRACEAKDSASCVHLGGALLALKGPSLQEGRELLERLCDDSRGAACFELGRQLSLGRSLRRDERRAERLLRRACALGTSEACPGSAGRADGDYRGLLHALGQSLRFPAKAAGTIFLGPLTLPFCAAGVKDNPLCPISWWK
jgi:TPR repeat protein